MTPGLPPGFDPPDFSEVGEADLAWYVEVEERALERLEAKLREELSPQDREAVIRMVTVQRETARAASIEQRRRRKGANDGGSGASPETQGAPGIAPLPGGPLPDANRSGGGHGDPALAVGS